MRKIEKHNLLWLILLIVPIVLNWIIGKNSDGWDVAGNVDSWVAFWGSYSGGCITAVISYIILRQTIGYYREENQSRQTDSHKKLLRADVSTRLAKLNTKKYGLLKNRLEEGENASSICEILDRDAIDMWNDFSSFKILYMGEYDAFITQYETLIAHVQAAVSRASNGIRSIPNIGPASEAREALIKNSSYLFEHLEELQGRVDELWNEASGLVR